MKVPIKVNVQHQTRAKLHEPFLVKFTIQNLSEEVFPMYVSFGADNTQANKHEKPNFLLAGELQSRVDLMPWSDDYVFAYMIVPMKLGIQHLPQFSISKRPILKQSIEKQIDASKPDLQQLLLLNGFTSKIYVSSK
jgi:hypothetical protein